jgi:hypothetical protein
MSIYDRFNGLGAEMDALRRAMAAVPNGTLDARDWDALEGLMHRLSAERREVGEQLYAAAKSAAEQVIAERERRNR